MVQEDSRWVWTLVKANHRQMHREYIACVIIGSKIQSFLIGKFRFIGIFANQTDGYIGANLLTVNALELCITLSLTPYSKPHFQFRAILKAPRTGKALGFSFPYCNG